MVWGEKSLSTMPLIKFSLNAKCREMVKERIDNRFAVIVAAIKHQISISEMSELCLTRNLRVFKSYSFLLTSQKISTAVDGT